MAGKNGMENAVPGAILLAIHDFVARSPDELSLAKGDRIELLERDDEFGDGWFLGKHLVNLNSGLFPEVYTTPAPKGTLKSSHKPRPGDAPKQSQQNSAVAAALPASDNKQKHDTHPTDPLGSAAAAATIAATSSLPTPPATANAQSPLASSAPRASLPAINPVTAKSFAVATDSPVMSETLSVIDEHITDMKAPRHASYINGNSKRDTITSVYSAHPSYGRMSYIAGHETDEEEQQALTKEEVMAWSPSRVAEHLEDIGVEKSHCEVFVEQDISGEVLLAMDQNSLFIKEFELGSVGRRLKTWHKIKALQDEVQRAASPEAEKRLSGYSAGQDSHDYAVGAGRNRSSTVGAPSLPRALTTKRQSGDSATLRFAAPHTQHISQLAASNLNRRESAGASSFQSLASASRPENTSRPSAQSIRNLNHSRRQSSLDSISTEGANRPAHRKQPSFDQKWQPGQPTNGRHGHTVSTDSGYPSRNQSVISPVSPSELDRGYFSSNEVDGPSRKNVLVKRNSTVVSPAISRDSSVLDANIQPARFTSMRSYEEPPSTPVVSSAHSAGPWSAMNRRFGEHRFGSTSHGRTKSRTSPQTPIAPVVTKLDPSSKHSLDAIAASPTNLEDNASEASSDKPTPSPSGYNLGFFHHAKAKVTGLRSISDAVTKEERTIVPAKIGSPTRIGTGSSTPSTDNRSLEMAKSDLASRESTGSGHNLMPPPPPPATRRPRAKSKKFTSAYTRGLEKKTPEESMRNCDYSGWMKKKSGSLVATWKTRLFVLKGRRLSYYYKDDDIEEKGLIDISFHRVLAAQNETLTGVLASAMGAGASPTSPVPGGTQTLAQRDLEKHPAIGEDDGLFIFKLVPPKAGMAKGVHFTKPTVHYFAVNSKQEGRLWMAALMKATIDRDETNLVTTTYNQKTISLEKARARRERPPALKDLDPLDGRAELGTGDESSERGLGIVHDGSATPGAEEERTDDTGSLAPSATLVEPASGAMERPPIALSS